MPSLNAGLLIGTNHVFVGTQQLAIPGSMIQIQYPSRFFLEIRISGPYPAPVTPRANCVLAQPAPDRRSTDGGHNTPLDGLLSDLLPAQTRERKPEVLWQLAGKGLDLQNDLRGKKSRVAPAVAFLGVRPGVGRRSVYATSKRFAGADQVSRRSACWTDHRLQGAPLSHA